MRYSIPRNNTTPDSYILELFPRQVSTIYIILDGLEGDTRIYCQRC